MVIKEIINRRSVRDFKPDAVPDHIIEELLHAAQFAPTSRNNRSVEFIIVKDAANRQRIYEAAVPKQEFVREAPMIIALATDPAKTNQPVQDLSLATENLWLQATALGFGAVWKNLKPPQAENVKKILGVPASFMMINIIPVGYPVQTMQPHTVGDYNPGAVHQERW